MYNYPSYYYDPPTQTIIAVILLDILLPIFCCIGIVVTILCVVKHINRKRQLERQ